MLSVEVRLVLARRICIKDVYPIAQITSGKRDRMDVNG